MRLFTGIALPQNVTDNLARLLDRLRPTAHINWSPVYNLHLTTKFIGEWPQDRLEELIGALQPVAQRSPISAAVTGLGWFPNPHSPRILFAAVSAGPELGSLAHDTDQALTSLGIPPEKKKFSPHLTLARIKDPAVPLGPLRDGISKLESIDFGSFTIDALHLYLSKTGPSGSIYTKLADFPLLPPK